ncbi:tyrosine-type recombinase/integrase [Xanthobacteraceae bacterium Astr-EGSB]|uniref:tyrosine-type recombinase/integrase n=1 Tax=Astrobacterium formosum TaxID=3069710 RepID=UPI0027B4029F|nr:tyrosine-type recombinase/integrase [Xanthobacteraceae bacterium Astr-EGSB]
MGRKAKDTTIEVCEGLYLKPRDGVYHCYFRIAGRQFRRSMKTQDLGNAQQQALAWFNDVKTRHARGEEIDQVSFAKLRTSYLEHIKGESKSTYHSETIARHFLPFFAKFSDVSKIKTGDVMDYRKYRVAKSETPPKPQTLNRENTVLRQLFRYAVDRGWMKQAPTVQQVSEKLTRHRRRHFTLDEYRLLRRTALARIKEFEHDKTKRYQLNQRQLLYDFILLVANTGMRVDETHSVIWRNVDFDHAQIRLERGGKVKSDRKLIMRGSAVRALTRIQERRLAFLAETDGKLSPNERVIAMPDGTAVASLKKGFGELLIACGFEYASKDDRHTPTSLRHSYATFRMTSTIDNRATIAALAKQMGTSQRMIEKHYGHDTIDDYQDELGGG